LIALATLVWAVFYHTYFTHIWAADAMKYAQTARNFVGGEGFVMGEVWPMHLASGIPLHAQTNVILHPLAIAGVFAVAGQSDAAVAVASGIFFILSAPLVFALGRRLFGTAAAFLTLALFLVEPWMLYYSVSGLTEPLFIFLLLLSVAALAGANGAASSKCVLAAGFFLGLAHLARPVGFVLMVPTLIFVMAGRSSKRGRVTGALALAGGFLVPVLISFAIVGALGEVAFERNSFHLLSQTKLHPGHSYVRTVVPLSFWSEIAARPEMHAVKWVKQLVQVHLDFFHRFASPLVTALFLAFPLVWRNGGRPIRLFFLVCGFFVVQGVLSVATFHSYRYFHPFLPLALPFACASLLIGLKRLLPMRATLRAVVIVLVAVWACYPFAFTAPIDKQGLVSRSYDEIRHAKDFTALGQFIRSNTAEDDVIITDAPWIATWYGDRMSVWLPNSPVDMVVLKDRVDIEWLLLTTEYGLTPQWQGLFERIQEERRGEGWVFTAGYEDERTAGYLFQAERPDSAFGEGVPRQ
jgi:4-amino-4-deoxy-L-arabinose transferase-like glycosyltransferase